MISIFYKFRYGFWNLYKWFRLIWSDRNYDHEFIDRMLLHKLKLTYSSLIKSNVNWDTHKKEIQALRICIAILQRRVDDWHFELSYGQGLNLKFLARHKNDEMLLHKRQTEFELFAHLYAKYQESWWF